MTRTRSEYSRVNYRRLNRSICAVEVEAGQQAHIAAVGQPSRGWDLVGSTAEVVRAEILPASLLLRILAGREGHVSHSEVTHHINVLRTHSQLDVFHPARVAFCVLGAAWTFQRQDHMA